MYLIIHQILQSSLSAYLLFLSGSNIQPDFEYQAQVTEKQWQLHFDS